jgi:hypothetical protein
LSDVHFLILEISRGYRVRPAWWRPRAGDRAASAGPRDQRTVVVSVDFFVAVVSPIGETVVPLDVDPVVVVTTPLMLLVFWLLVSVETTGAGMTGVVVVVVVLEDEDCA